ncbi:MAG: hypothetical protein M0Z33_08690 [Actinomycetota bacterium]|nr:hypothetical protein [Actinomycetota bacterium]
MADADTPAEGPDDWASHATRLVEQAVTAVRDRSTRPVLFAVRALVVGTLVAVVSVFLVVAFSVGVVRLLTDDAFGGRVWASDLVVGGIFSGAGAFLLTRSGARRSHDVGR